MDLGNFNSGSTIYHKFTTYSATNGSPGTLASGTISVYKNNTSNPTLDGVTLVADWDSKTGLNHLTINTGATNAFYTAGAQYDIVLTAGTVNGVSAQGKVASFKLNLNTPEASNSEIAASNAALLAARLTSTRAGYLDSIPQAASNASNALLQALIAASNAEIAASNTVVLIARLTATRAGYLDSIPQTASNASNTYIQVLALASNMTVALASLATINGTNTASLVLNSMIDSTYTLKKYIEAIGAGAAGASSGVAAGAPKYKNLANDKTVIDTTAVAGDRALPTYTFT